MKVFTIVAAIGFSSCNQENIQNLAKLQEYPKMGPVITHHYAPDYHYHYDYAWPYNSSDIGMPLEGVHSKASIA